jgi:transposase
VLARLRHQQFATVAEVDAAIAALLPSVNERPFQKLAGSRASVFAELDAPALGPLPAQRYELARFKTVKVHIDYHVEIEAHRYSVPHALVGQTLEARLTRSCVELLLRGTRVASHTRSEPTERKGGCTTVDAHMPAAHRAHKEWTPERLIEWGKHIGLSTGELVTRQLHLYKHPEHAYRSCLGLLGLAKRYGSARLEAACERALALGTFKYRHVRDLLANKRDQMPPPDQSDWVSPAHANLRGPDYYQ